MFVHDFYMSIITLHVLRNIYIHSVTTRSKQIMFGRERKVGIPLCFLCHWRLNLLTMMHDDVIKWKHFPCYWPFVREIHRSPVNSPHKGQWRGALMFTLIWAWIDGWVNNRKAGDLRRHRADFDITIMLYHNMPVFSLTFWSMNKIFVD